MVADVASLRLRRFNAATTRRPWRTRSQRRADRQAKERFNAATTRRPWRTRQCGETALTTDRFNAATTRRPWRTRRPRDSRDQRAPLQCGHDPKAVENADSWRPTPSVVASMRPRPEGRGEPTREWLDRSCRTQLQCGHDPKAVENLRRDVASRTARRASMRPRPEGRGEPRRRPWRRRAHAASMRPRPEGRGEPLTALPHNLDADLLQCGHDPKAVENASGGRRRSLRDVASMRPRPEGRGELAGGTTAGVDTGASMRPRPEGRGERRGQRRKRRTVRRFNAATTRRPWRTAARSSSRRPIPRLQCGHDPKAVENREAFAAIRRGVV